MSAAAGHAYLTPADLSMLGRAFALVCSAKAIASSSAEAELVAAELIRAFQSGVRDENRLVAAFGCSMPQSESTIVAFRYRFHPAMRRSQLGA